MRWTTLLLAMGLLLAGCSDSPGTTTSSTTTATAVKTAPTQGTTTEASQTGTSSSPPAEGGENGTAAENGPPTATLQANVTSGPIPLDVSFALGGSDPDGDTLTAQLKVGDAEPVTVAVPGTHLHTFDAAGNYTIVLSVSDGNETATAEVVVTATVAAPGVAHCHREPTEEAEGIYVFDGDGGTWVFLEDNGVPGLQVANTHPSGEAGVDETAGAYNAAWEGCEAGDLMVF